MAFCLIKDLADKMKNAIRSGKLNPEKLNNMTSAERRKFLEGVVGKEVARDVNLSFEKKILLKNQERAMYDWAADITGISKEAKAATLEKIRQGFADKKRRLHEPKQNEQFLNEILADTYSKKYKTEVTLEEAQAITELGADAAVAKRKLEEVTGQEITKDVNKPFRHKEGITPNEEMAIAGEYATSLRVLENYTGNLVDQAGKMKFFNPFKEKGLAGKTIGAGQNLSIARKFIFSNARTIRATWDNSAWGRNVRKLMTDPPFMKVWGKNFIQSHFDIAKVVTGYDVGSVGALKRLVGEDAIRVGKALSDAKMVSIYAKQDFLNGRYENKGGTPLAIRAREEEVPSVAPQRIPVIGRLFVASDVAFSRVNIMRAEAASIAYKMAEKQGRVLDTNLISEINKNINMITGRGEVGRLGKGTQEFLNETFFAIKWAKSQIDFINPVNIAKKDKFARNMHMRSLLSFAISTYVYKEMMQVAFGGESSNDPRSPLFGKIKVGTRVTDVSGGVASYITFAARIFTNSTVNPTTGLAKELGEGFGQRDAMGVFFDFIDGKLSPGASMIRDMVNRKDFNGQASTLETIALNSLVPISANTLNQLLEKPEGAYDLAFMIGEVYGLGGSIWEERLTEAEKIAQDLTLLQPKEANDQLDLLKEEDKTLYNNVDKALKDIKLGVSSLDKAMRNMGIDDKQKSIYIANQMKDMTADEKNEHLAELKEKGIIDIKVSKKGKESGSGVDVIEQLKEIEEAGGIEPFLQQEAKKAENSVDAGNVLALYWKAFEVDPEMAWMSLWTPEEIEKIEGNTIIFRRDVLSNSEIRKMKIDRGLDPDDYELEHILDRQLGGPILDPKNHQYIKKSSDWHKDKTRVTNYLRRKLWAFDITKEASEGAIFAWMNDETTEKEIKNMTNKQILDRWGKTEKGILKKQLGD